jgi:hypothetical protein
MMLKRWLCIRRQPPKEMPSGGLGLGELVRNPFSRWVRGHSQPQDLAAIVMQYQQPTEQAE